jgi:hypothetical protein
MKTEFSLPDLLGRDRWESLKAAAVAAIATGATEAGFTWLSQGWSVIRVVALPNGWPEWLLSIAIAVVSGALFGLTYRYALRQDQNPHLKSGVVVAFGLVRALAQIELGLQYDLPLLALAFLAGSSLLLFQVASTILDAAIAQAWVQPFSASNPDRPLS